MRHKNFKMLHVYLCTHCPLDQYITYGHDPVLGLSMSNNLMCTCFTICHFMLIYNNNGLVDKKNHCLELFAF